MARKRGWSLRRLGQFSASDVVRRPHERGRVLRLLLLRIWPPRVPALPGISVRLAAVAIR